MTTPSSTRFEAAADRFKIKLHTSAAEVEKTFGEWAKAVVGKRGALAERAAVLFNIAKIRSRLTPPLDHRPKAEIAATKAVIDDLQKDELAPLNRVYRHALVKEKASLATLAKLERAYSGTPHAAAAPVAAAPSVPPQAAQRPTYGSIPGAGRFTPKFNPTPKLDPAFDDATLARMVAERARQSQVDRQLRHEAWAAPKRADDG